MQSVGYFHETFSTNWILISSVFLLIGGGNRVLSAVLNTIIVDVSPIEKRFHIFSTYSVFTNFIIRTRIFYILGVAVLMDDLIATPIGAWLLQKDLWLPYKFTTPLLFLAFPIILAMPETLKPKGSLADESYTEVGSETSSDPLLNV
jgi:hypothetical protein